MSKAGALSHLRDALTTAQIAPMVTVDWSTWKHYGVQALTSLDKNLPPPWIVRSSCTKEDDVASSQAGHYLSILHVSQPDLAESVERVFASYAPSEDADEVLIQSMLRDVVRSGVAFSHCPNTCSPYRVINWTDGDSTTIVTSGEGGRTWQGAAARALDLAPDHLKSVVALLNELLVFFDGMPIDCEYAITRDESGADCLWLLQVRPLILPRLPMPVISQTRLLSRIESKVARSMVPHPFLLGCRTIYGVMPDWNPAEIIGVRPKPLAMTLYRDLVTNTIWSQQRNNYGYRSLSSFPLMPHFCGLPYIDVRLSMNSFIPAALDDPLADRLVNYYIQTLLARPVLHDKVEFEIVFSCYTFDLKERFLRLKSAGFSECEQAQLANSLRVLTQRVFDPSEGLWRSDAQKLTVLCNRRERLYASTTDDLERIYWLLEDGRCFGSLPFAGLARAGFIAVEILRSLVAVDVLSSRDVDAFLGSLSTVNRQLVRDRAILDKASFLQRYGHLRPGTYDILTSRYDEAPERYFDWSFEPVSPPPEEAFSLTPSQIHEIGSLLRHHDLHINVMSLFEFMRRSIELREMAKFEFSRNLSDALHLIGRVGEELGFERESMAYCDVAALKELHLVACDAKDLISRSIDQGRNLHNETMALALPPIIAQPSDVWAFEWPDTEPNYITTHVVTAPVVGSTDRALLAGAIVCIPSADPGYDWLFSYPIAGLITAWGGVNSHMAIRAGELGLPAIIGAGENLFRRLSAASRIHIDCAGRRVEIVS